jgi:hypothetical protein
VNYVSSMSLGEDKGDGEDRGGCALRFEVVLVVGSRWRRWSPWSSMGRYWRGKRKPTCDLGDGMCVGGV